MIIFNFNNTIGSMRENTQDFKKALSGLMKEESVELTKREYELALILSASLLKAYDENGDADIHNMYNYIIKDNTLNLIVDKECEKKLLIEETKSLLCKITNKGVNIDNKVFWLKGLRKFYVFNLI